ncbi:hypothetical protein N7532_007544 [Penicillium argentinense]|uniref:Uncharacterized protein n=1 Tax=Penicillium argentinense TaxID=1131581 RepID=A0A9W9F7X2_9EURO|nr:uncharacterized protein N7532_007544 [Penicillium argentinense]KAJ5095253.1 hypothetical protein N7532_007544 [Penicillium argentinense]
MSHEASQILGDPAPVGSACVRGTVGGFPPGLARRGRKRCQPWDDSAAPLGLVVGGSSAPNSWMDSNRGDWCAMAHRTDQEVRSGGDAEMMRADDTYNGVG